MPLSMWTRSLPDAVQHTLETECRRYHHRHLFILSKPTVLLNLLQLNTSGLRYRSFGRSTMKLVLGSSGRLS